VAIPPLVNGVLPPGTYRAALGEIVQAFDQAGSATRPALNIALQHAVDLIRSRDPAALIYVGGSYITATTNPGDVDLAVRSDIWNETLFTAAFVTAHPREVALVDFYFAPKQSIQHMEDLLREIKGSSSQKGVRDCPGGLALRV